MAQTPQNSDNPYKGPGPVFNESRGFTGLDLWTNPQDQTGNFLLGADNVLNRAGMLQVRPGMYGMFGGIAPSSSSSSSPSGASSSSSAYYDVGATSYGILGGSTYDLCDFVDDTGATWILQTALGKVYKTPQAGGFHVELVDVGGASYTFNSGAAQAVKFQDFVYIVDGAHPWVRIDLTGGFPAYAMIAPTGSPSAALTNSLLFQANNAANWSFDGQATALGNIAPNAGQDTSGNSQIINGSNLRGNGWVITGEQGPTRGGYPDEVNVIAGGVNICVAGTPPSGASPGQGGLITVNHFAGANANASLYPSRFHVLLYCVKNDFNSNPNTYSANCLITPYSSAGVQLGVAQIIAINPAGNTAQVIDTIIDFSGLGPQVAGLTVQIVNHNSSSQGNLYVGPISITPITVQTMFGSAAKNALVYPSLTGGQIVASSSSSSSSSGGSSSSSLSGALVISSPPTDLGSVLDYEGTSLIYTFPVSSSSSSSSPGSASSSSSGQPEGGVNLSTTNRFVIGVGSGQIAAWSGFQVSLSLIQNIGGTSTQSILADNGVTISADLTGLDCDISTLDAAQLVNIVGIKLTFLANVTWVSPFYALPLGPITAPGNLSIASGQNGINGALLAGYSWYVTESAVIDSENVIESNPSLASSVLLPTFAQAEALIGLPAECPRNAETTEYTFYRLGGAWPDVRLIATVSRTVSVAYGSDPNNPYYSWNAATGVLLDNTPDLFLAVATLMSFSKDPMPANAQAIAVWQGRVCAGVGNQLYLSWLYNSDNSAPLLTTLISNLDDPNYPIDGATFPVSPDSSDVIVAMCPFGTPVLAGNEFGGGLLIFCTRSVWMLEGTDVSNFDLKEYPYSKGVGLIAARGWERISPNQVIFMGPDRLHVFPPQGDSPHHDLGRPIQPLLYPAAPQTLQNSSAFALSWMRFHDSKLFLGCPQPGGSSNSVVFVYDFLVGGWTRLTGPLSPLTSSSSSSSSSNSSSSSGGPSFDISGMAMTSAISLPPTGGGADYDLYMFGLDGQMYRMTGTVDQFSPISMAQPIPFSITVHALRPGFFYRYKLHPLFYMWARLEFVWIEMMMTGLLQIQAQAFTAGTDNPLPIAGAQSVQYYQLAGGGRPFEMNMPSGLIEGQFIEVTVSGSVTDVAYCRGIRGFVSGTTYEQA